MKTVPPGFEWWISDTGQPVLVHAKDRCSGICSIHCPSDHHMASWPRHWRSDRQLMERICPCGTGHPDPQHLQFIKSRFGTKRASVESVHGCCGHCRKPI